MLGSVIATILMQCYHAVVLICSGSYLAMLLVEIAPAIMIYNLRVREVEHGVFTPLVCTSTGGVSWEATVFYKRLADLLVTHWGQPYSSTIHWLRCRLSFALLRSAILCIRGSRSSVHRPVKGPLDLSVVLVESRLTD